jgi:hypothetical protein
LIFPKISEFKKKKIATFESLREILWKFQIFKELNYLVHEQLENGDKQEGKIEYIYWRLYISPIHVFQNQKYE